MGLIYDLKLKYRRMMIERRKKRLEILNRPRYPKDPENMDNYVSGKDGIHNTKSNKTFYSKQLYAQLNKPCKNFFYGKDPKQFAKEYHQPLKAIQVRFRRIRKFYKKLKLRRRIRQYARPFTTIDANAQINPITNTVRRSEIRRKKKKEVSNWEEEVSKRQNRYKKNNIENKNTKKLNFAINKQQERYKKDNVEDKNTKNSKFNRNKRRENEKRNIRKSQYINQENEKISENLGKDSNTYSQKLKEKTKKYKYILITFFYEILNKFKKSLIGLILFKIIYIFSVLVLLFIEYSLSISLFLMFSRFILFLTMTELQKNKPLDIIDTIIIIIFNTIIYPLLIYYIVTFFNIIIHINPVISLDIKTLLLFMIDG
jgi:hypothetical protein